MDALLDLISTCAVPSHSPPFHLSILLLSSLSTSDIHFSFHACSSTYSPITYFFFQFFPSKI
jgi:hypothetical protein